MTSDDYDRLDAMANAEVKRLEDKIDSLKATVCNQRLEIEAWEERYEEVAQDNDKMRRDLVRIRDIAAGKR